MSPRRKMISILTAFLVVITVLFVVSRGMQSPRQLDIARMNQLQEAIESFASTNGNPPETLAELNLAPELLLDHSGHPIQYSVSGTQITLTSFGGDQKPGGKAFKADYDHVFSLPVTSSP